jgi:hypothetical protein
MNSSDLFILPSFIDKLNTRNLSIDIFYIGTFIGLSGGFLSMCIIGFYKYKKRKLKLESPIEVTL